MCYGSSKQAIPDQSILSQVYRTAYQINLFEMETPYQGTSIKDNHTYSYTNHPSRYYHWNIQLDHMLLIAVKPMHSSDIKLSKLPWRTEISNFSPKCWNKTNFKIQLFLLNTRNIVMLWVFFNWEPSKVRRTFWLRAFKGIETNILEKSFCTF